MGNSIVMDEKAVPYTNSAYDIMVWINPEFVKYCKKWHQMTKNLKRVFPESGTFNTEVLDIVRSRINSIVWKNES